MVCVKSFLSSRYARVAQRWSTSLPRRGSRVRSPSRALKNRDTSKRMCLYFFRVRFRTRRFDVYFVSVGAEPRSPGPRLCANTLSLLGNTIIQMHLPIAQFILCSQQQIAIEHFQILGSGVNPIFYIIIIGSYQRISKVPGMLLKGFIVH